MGSQWTVYGASLLTQSVEFACNAGALGLIPGLERSPEKGMATHSSILAWEINGQRRMVVHEVVRVRHDLATKPPPTPDSLFSGS